MTIKSIVKDSELLKIENFKEQKKVSEKVKELIKKYKEPDLTLLVFNPETNTLKIPFEKKDESILPKIKLSYFNTSTKKNEDFLVYDYTGHLTKFGFDWIQSNIGLRYRIKINNSDNRKIKKQLTLSAGTRKQLFVDESRIWNMEWSWKPGQSALDKTRISYLVGYFENETIMKSMLRIADSSHDFTSMFIAEKSSYLRRYTRHVHQGQPNTKQQDFFYSGLSLSYTVLMHILNSTILRFTDRIRRLFITKFYHDRKDWNFLKGLIYIGEKKEIDEKYFSEVLLFGRKLYEYQIDRHNKKPLRFTNKETDWSFPDKYYSSIGFTIHGFSFKFQMQKKI